MWGRILTWIKRLLIALATAQLALVAALVGVDLWRRRVRPPEGRFPRTEPRTASVGGTEVTTYTHGEELFDAMLQAIRGARKRIFFESYIVKDDSVGQRFKAALVEAAERGVEVHVIYDGFANLVVPPRFLRFPPPVHVLRYPVMRLGAPLMIRRTGRDHRKILVVDDEVGFIGGYNVGTDYATRWRDTHLRLQGPSVWELENAFIDFWNAHRSGALPRLEHSGPAPWNTRIRAYRNVPYQLIYPIRAMYLEAIDRATRRIHITQGYFIPDRELADALLAAARRGVQVDILLPEHSNHVIADWLSRGWYSILLRGGVRLWLYRDAMVHAKTATIDGLWSTVGTANIDRLSLTGNYEINLELIDSTVAAHLENAFANDLGNARRLTAEEWATRPVWAKAAERMLSPLWPLL
jgi:cardiolipin synthase A/B